MNILVIGTGAIGVALGASLLSGDAHVSFYSTKQTAQAIGNNGIKRTGLFGTLKFSPDKFDVYTGYTDMPEDSFDYILIATKTLANKDVSRKLSNHRSILKKSGKIIIFQNGFGNDEEYLKYFDKSQVFCARIITGFIRPERHISKITVHTAPVMIGSLQNENSESVKIISQMINSSGIPCETTDCIDKYLWAKMLYNCTLNPLSAIVGVNYGKLTENKYTVDIMNNIIDEIFEVIRKSQYTTFWNSAGEYRKEFYNKLVPDTYDHESSMLQDITKKQETEIDSLTGKIIKLADKYNVNVKTNRTIYNLIKTRQLEFKN